MPVCRSVGGMRSTTGRGRPGALCPGSPLVQGAGEETGGGGGRGRRSEDRRRREGMQGGGSCIRTNTLNNGSPMKHHCVTWGGWRAWI